MFWEFCSHFAIFSLIWLSEMYIWQYQMGFGKKKNPFSPYLEITEDSNPPDEPALYFSHSN